MQALVDKTKQKTWRLTIGINHYWLNDSEKDFYLQVVGAGKEFAVLPDSGMVLSAKFLDLVSTEAIAASEKRDKGQWQCQFGYWHSESADCWHTEDEEKMAEEPHRLEGFNKPRTIGEVALLHPATFEKRLKNIRAN